MKTINKVNKDITTIIIAHRLSTIKKCDRIFVLQNGVLVEEGKHKSLLSKKGLYSQLWKNQMEDFK